MNNIVQINIHKHDSKTKLIKNGIILNPNSGYILSTYNHHYENDIIIAFHPSLGLRQLDIDLISVCPAKNLSLYRLKEHELKVIAREYSQKSEKGKLKTVKIQDNLKLKLGDDLKIHEYVDNNLKISSSEIQSFDFEYINIEDCLTRPPYTIKISGSYLNGAGVYTENGSLVGLCCNNQMIPIRTFMAIYNKMLDSKVVKIPNLGLSWNETNRDLMAAKTGNEGYYAIYVRDIFGGSCILELVEGDVIFDLSYITKNMSLDFDFEDSFKITGDEKMKVEFDRYGCMDVYPNPNQITRKLCLAEFVDMIPIDSELKIQFCRDGKTMELGTQFEYIESNRISYREYNEQSYDLLAGIICRQLTLEDIRMYPQLRKHIYDNNSYIIISKIFPGSLLDNVRSFCEGDIIVEINKVKVSTISKLRKILKTNPNAISIKTSDNTYFVSSKDKIMKDDQKYLKFCPDYTYLLN